MQTKRHLPSLLSLIVLVISLLLLVGLSALLTLASFIYLFKPAGNDPASTMISAAAFGFMAVVLGVCAWFVLKKVRGQAQADLPFNLQFRKWLWILIPVVAFVSLLFGGLISIAELPWLSWLFLPALTLFVIALPIWLFLGAASNGIESGPRWRFFSVLGLSMTLSPFIMVVLELVALAVIIIAGAFYVVATNPQIALEIQSLNIAMDSAANQEAVMRLLAPYLSNPFLIAVGIGYIALLVPMIEELLKPLAVWLFAKQIDTPAQGFALGALSGAGFALMESLNASADGSMSWAFVVGARTGTSVLHITTSALVGWGIASAFKQKRARRFFAPYAAAVLIHGLWNACAAGAGLTANGQFFGKPEWLFNLTPALLCGLLVMGIGVIALLIASNRKLRTESPHSKEEVKVESPA